MGRDIDQTNARIEEIKRLLEMQRIENGEVRLLRNDTTEEKLDTVEEVEPAPKTVIRSNKFVPSEKKGNKYKIFRPISEDVDTCSCMAPK